MCLGRDLRVNLPIFLAENDVEAGAIRACKRDNLPTARCIDLHRSRRAGDSGRLLELLFRGCDECSPTTPCFSIFALQSDIDVRIFAVTPVVYGIFASCDLHEAEVFGKKSEFFEIGVLKIDVS